MQALQGAAWHRAVQPPPAPHAAQQQRPAAEAEHQQRRRGTGRQPAPGIAQQQLAVQVFHPARQQAGLVGAQHLGAGRVDAPGLGLLAVKGVHHQGACRLAAQRFHPWDGLLHLLGQRGQTQGWAGAVGSGLRKLCGVASQGLQGQHPAGQCQHHHQQPQAQGQGAVQ